MNLRDETTYQDLLIDVIYFCIRGKSSYTLYNNDMLAMTDPDISNIAEYIIDDIIPFKKSHVINKIETKRMIYRLIDGITRLNDKSWVLTRHYIVSNILQLKF